MRETLKFTKYQGAGNDFVIIDLRHSSPCTLSVEQIAHLCNRRLGIGADGFMTLDNDPSGGDFYMRYWNADGRESTMCGNGGRCIAHFANSLGLAKDNMLNFSAIDGQHTAQILPNDVVKLRMIDAPLPTTIDENTFLVNTGSPHYIQFVDDVETINLAQIAPPLRQKYNANVNFVNPQTLQIRTWERGVENETLACGTGATAAAITLHYSGLTALTNVTLKTRCDALEIDFLLCENGFSNIFLTGQAKKVFDGEVRF